jgi:hypothetical protein
LCALFREVSDVFVATDLFWYAVEGHPEIRTAPDVFVAFGRPKGDRGSYRQWEEGGAPVTVAFEVLSPGNTVPEMADKFAFYEDYGVEEYYLLYDPDANRLQAFVRRGEALVRVRQVAGFVSPRLGIRFDLSGSEMAVFYPNGERFLSFEGLKAQHEREQGLRKAAEAQHERERGLRKAAEQRAARLAELGRKARRGQASAEEVQELGRLEEQLIPPTTP